MFRTIAAKVPLRRCLHTAPRSTAASRPSRAGAVVAGSAVVATYLAWRTLQGDKIALDSVATSSKHASAGAKVADAPDAVAGARQADPEEASLEESLTDPTDMREHAEEESESGGGAYNPVTGEINWDCPCLGGMAHGPCGLQFREAFSCFVFSEKEPKGIDCVEKFKAMQDCFREHPEHYGEDIMNDDDEEEDVAPPAGDSPVGGHTSEATAQTLSESQAEQPASKPSASAA
ncbi:uncharacterized protein B0H18DRAFT_300922 [Fomitopsis serialis]|uniref:uncharacterized protein n=1 Tax=Fomitopsis serialis TaxID=139415 RepID=UPI00200830D4|nr:uncharacterized protein B0H18DRAFT_300922 [Neoantrodia serialis]KAH9911835.1 hypothetical protein B0H18DRAFT_300922 [Neoantrodia serialis]